MFTPTGSLIFLGAIMIDIVLSIVALTQAAAPSSGLPDAISTMPEGMKLTVLGQIITFLTVLLGFGISLYREHRNRKWDREEKERQRRWDLEDRERAREEQRQTALALAKKTERTAEDLARRTELNTEKAAEIVAQKLEEKTNAVLEKVEENTQVSKKAFEEANNFNRRLEAITRQFLPDADIPTAVEKLTTIEQTTAETKEKVDDIHGALDDVNKR